MTSHGTPRGAALQTTALDVEGGLTCSTLVDLLELRASQAPGRLAYSFLRDDDVRVDSLSRGELQRDARAIGVWLQRRGLSGERLLLACRPGLGYVKLFFGCVYAGAVPVTCYPPKPRADGRISAIVVDSSPAAVLVSSGTMEEPVRRAVGPGDIPILSWDPDPAQAEEWAGLWERPAIKRPAINSSTLALLQYTSGSTADPHGVMVSHGNILHNSAAAAAAFAYSEASLCVTWLPMYHDMGLIGGVIQPLHGGFPCIMMSPSAFLSNPYRWLDTISRYKATISGGPNFAFDLCVERITGAQKKTLDLGSWETAFNGSESVRADTMERFAEAFGDCGFRRQTFRPCYGLAEATLIVSAGGPTPDPLVLDSDPDQLQRGRIAVASPAQTPVRLVGCGEIAAKHEVVIVDPEAQVACAPGEVGEIWVSGPSVAQGYWNRTEETSRVFRAFLHSGLPGPFLRTGDLGFVQDRQLFITGRIKDLIVIRGRNHYPQDIEWTVAQSHPALRSGRGAAFCLPGEGEERLAVAHEIDRQFKGDFGDVARRIREAVADAHGLHAHSVLLVKFGRLPRTSSGKVQRHACKAKAVKGGLKTVWTDTAHPSSPEMPPIIPIADLLALDRVGRERELESFIRNSIATLLRVAPETVDGGTPLSRLGLDSLMAGQLNAHVESYLGLCLPVTGWLEDFRIDELAAQLADRLEESASSSPTAPDRDADTAAVQSAGAPLSFFQERVWFLTGGEENDGALNVARAFRLRGQLDVAALARAIDSIVSRHEILRTVFRTVRGRPVQVTVPALPAEVGYVDLRLLDRCRQNEESRRWSKRLARAPFDSSRLPLYRPTLFGFSERERVLVLVMSHLISDSWSLDVWMRDLSAAYRPDYSMPEPLPLAYRYNDFVRWQRKLLTPAVVQRQSSYWMEKLAALPEVQFSWDGPRSPQTDPDCDHLFFELPAGLSAQLRVFSREARITLFMLLLAAFKALLSRCCGQPDIVVSTPIAYRDHAGFREAIGCVANRVALRTDLSGNPEFAEVLQRVRRTALDAYANQDLPFGKVLEAAGNGNGGAGGRDPLSRILFQTQEVSDLPGIQGVDVEPELLPPPDVLADLAVLMLDRPNSLAGFLTYNRRYIPRSTAEAIVASYESVLERVIQDPKVRIGQLPVSVGLEWHGNPRSQAEAPPTVAISSTFTAEPVAAGLEFWLRELGIAWQIGFAPYRQCIQQLLDPASLLSNNHDGINVILTRFEDWRTAGPASAAKPLGVGELDHIERRWKEFLRVFEEAVGRSAVPLLLCICEPSAPVLADDLMRRSFEDLEEYTASRLRALPGASVVTARYVQELYPVSPRYDSHADLLGNIPYTQPYFIALATVIARRIYRAYIPPHKVIVLDCDQTLWTGVCGEGQPSEVEVDPPRRSLQAFMLKQREEGKLLCLCSKNNVEDVRAAFEFHPDMPLQWDHFQASRINWKPKPENIESLADELQLGLDSFVFVDDDPAECGEMQSRHPEVLTLQLPEAESIESFLAHVWAFDSGMVTAEDRSRAALYRQHADRERFRSQSMTLEEFLAGLELEISIAPATSGDVSRIAQLTQRTNQFNASSVRQSEAQIAWLVCSSEEACLIVEVSDRFGEYGIVGVMMFRAVRESLQVTTFLLSCRALGRRVEHRMLAKLGEIALERGLRSVDLRFVPTRQNRPARDFFLDVGGEFEERSDTESMFRIPAGRAAALTTHPAARRSTQQ